MQLLVGSPPVAASLVTARSVASSCCGEGLHCLDRRSSPARSTACCRRAFAAGALVTLVRRRRPQQQRGKLAVLCRESSDGGTCRRRAAFVASGALAGAGAALSAAAAPAPLPPASGSWALVTGASSGIGVAVARRLAAEGFGLFLTARSRGPLDALAAEVRSGKYRSTRAEVIVADLAEASGVQAVHDALVAHGGDVAVAVINAGRSWTGPLVQQPAANLREMLALNVVGTADLCRLLAADMVAKGRGRLMLVSSVAGTTNGVAGVAAYAGSKSFVRALAQGLRDEVLGSGVAVTCLLPGATDSKFQEVSGMQRSVCFNVPFARELGVVSSADFVAECGVQALLRGDSECVPGFLNTIVTLLPTFASRAIAEISFSDAPWLQDRSLQLAFAAGSGAAAAAFIEAQPAYAQEALSGTMDFSVLLPATAALLAGLIGLNIAENGSVDSPVGATKRTLTLEDVLAVRSKADFVALWRGGALPEVPAGRELSGRLLPLGALWASSWAITNFLFSPGPSQFWQGKGFAQDGATGYNRFDGEARLRTFRPGVESSLLDGQPCLALDYGADDCDAFWGGLLGMRDELREVSPGLYLGLGSMRATGGMWNCAPFVLFEEEAMKAQ